MSTSIGQTVRRTLAATPAGRRVAGTGVVDAVVVGVLGTLIGFAGSWVPSFWFDEAATISAGDRPLLELVSLVRRIDAVHALYYAGMHGWFAVFGASELMTRLPSALAVGVAAAGVVVLGRRLHSRGVGVVAGLFFVLLPRVTWSAIEARSYAFTAAAAVWLALCLLQAVQSDRRRWWVGYACGVAFSTALFVYDATLVVAHLATLLLVRQPRATLLRFATAAGLGLLATAPVVYKAVRQRVQIDWIRPLTPEAVWRDQWFSSPLLAGLVYLLLAAAVVVGVTVLRRRRSASAPVADPAPGRIGTLPLALPWVLVPMALVIGYTLLVRPIYLDRYLTMTAGGLALLVGLAIRTLSTSRVFAAVVLTVLAVVAAPTYLEQRTEWAKPSGMDYSQAADAILGDAQTGDCVVFERRVSWNPATMNVVATARPDAFRGLVDISRGTTAEQEDALLDTNLTADQIPAGRMAACRTVWVLTERERPGTEVVYNTFYDSTPLPGPYRFTDTVTFKVLQGAGFRVDVAQELHLSQWVRLTR